MLKKYIILSVSLFFSALLLSCSTATKLAYNNSGALLNYWVNDYLAMDDQQEELLRERYDRFLAWHRKTELPALRKFLQEAKQKTEAGPTATDIEWLFAQTRVAVERNVQPLLPDITELLLQLSPEQIARLEKRLQKDNDKQAKQYAKAKDKRQSERGEKLLDEAKNWLGKVSDAQRQMIADYNTGLAFLDTQVLADRKQRQQLMLQLMKAKPSKAAAEAQLTTILLKSSSWRDADYQQLLKAREAQVVLLAKALGESLTDAQRKHLQKKLQGYIDDFEALSRVD